jgi:hypothetical protein
MYQTNVTEFSQTLRVVIPNVVIVIVVAPILEQVKRLTGKCQEHFRGPDL